MRQYVERFELTSADTVLDPFCGTGTTLVECKKLGLRSAGIERNPVAAFASEVKVSWGVDPDGLLEHARQVASATEEKLADEGLSECSDLPLFRPATSPVLFRTLPTDASALLLKDSISPAPLHRTLALLETISDLRDDRFAGHELLALAKGLVSGISNLEFGPEVGVGKPRKDAPVVQIWMNAVQEMAEDLRFLEMFDGQEACVLLGDSRCPASIMAPSSIDAVITSPPYPNEKDYTRTTRLESVLLNFIRSKDELRALKRDLVRSNTRGIYRDDSDDSLIAGNVQVQALAQAIEARRIELGKTSGFERMYPRVTKLYFGGMARHLLEMRGILRPGAHLAYVVGDQASYLRVMIRTGQLLAEIASSAGYEVLGIDLFRTRLSTATRQHLREEVLLLRWPASGSHQNSICNKEATVSSVLPRMERNTLYYGDNLDVLRRHVPSESVDLVYLDPPFKSNQDYNILFAEQDGSRSAAQIKAFEDTWRWDRAAVESYLEVVERGGKVGEAMQGFRKLLGDNDMLAYLAMMAPRLVELHRTMKPTGSIYLHCDPTASHYLKLMMDAVFDARNFRSEIIWRRTGTHGKAKRYAPIHDTVLFYVKSHAYKWNYPKRPYMKGHVEEYFVRDDRGWRTAYYGNVLTGSGLRKGESGAPWRGFDPSRKGRHWAIPGAVIEDIDEDLSGFSQHEKLDRLFELGYIKIVDGQAWPVYEHYLAPQDGQAVSDIWANQPYTSGTVFGSDAGIDEDVKWLSPRDQERLGYPTQKPEGLLERIIRASSGEDDVVLDPFCGCGTAIAVANRLNRRWIGIDITHLAITLIKHRLLSQGTSTPYYQVIGEPVSLPDAEALARQDPHQFQWWALGIVGARPAEQKRGADKGIDGRLYFHHNGKSPKTSQIIFSVKSGNTSVRDARDLRGVIEREQAELGVLITLRSPTGPMRREAAGAGLYHDEWSGEKYNRMQIITIRELLEGRQVQYPRYLGNTTFRRAGKQKRDRKARSLPLIRK